MFCFCSGCTAPPPPCLEWCGFCAGPRDVQDMWVGAYICQAARLRLTKLHAKLPLGWPVAECYLRLPLRCFVALTSRLLLVFAAALAGFAAGFQLGGPGNHPRRGGSRPVSAWMSRTCHMHAHANGIGSFRQESAGRIPPRLYPWPPPNGPAAQAPKPAKSKK